MEEMASYSLPSEDTIRRQPLVARQSAQELYHAGSNGCELQASRIVESRALTQHSGCDVIVRNVTEKTSTVLYIA